MTKPQYFEPSIRVFAINITLVSIWVIGELVLCVVSFYFFVARDDAG